MGTDTGFTDHGAEADRAAFSALLADVPESDHPETMADPADPDLFFSNVYFCTVWHVSAAAADRIADPAASGFIRNGNFRSIPVCLAFPFSFFCTLSVPEQAYGIAKAFGEFQQQLTDLPGRLHETIPDFHNTPKRIEQLEQAIKNDAVGRVAKVQKEIDFILSRKEEAGTLVKLNASGDIPERITHNDTKCNNVLIDDLTGEGVAVIDLDTVMPGLSLYDFGDMVRTCTSPADEDEVNLSKVYMQFNMYEALFRGFCDAANCFMTPAEKENLAFAGKLITLEIGTRFLADYLNGDTYFKIKRPEQNLDRCRSQLKLVTSIEEQMDAMQKLLLK